MSGAPAPELVALTAGLVAGLRKEFPQIDGRAVYLASLLVAFIVACAETPGGGARELALHTLKLWAGATALASGASYVATKAAPHVPPGDP